LIGLKLCLLMSAIAGLGSGASFLAVVGSVGLEATPVSLGAAVTWSTAIMSLVLWGRNLVASIDQRLTTIEECIWPEKSQRRRRKK
jgi:hypothetical protein